MGMRFNELDAMTLKERIRKNPIALLPLGAVEIHGAHLPTGTDSILAERLCERLAETTGALVMPTVHYTQVWSLGEFTGTVSVSTRVLTDMLTEILLGMYNNGIQIIALVNAHLGNNTVIKEAARAAMGQQRELKVMIFTYPEAERILPEVMDQTNFHGGFFHADEIETSYMLYLAPEYVNMERAVNADIELPELFSYIPMRWSSFTDDAVMGHAANATADKGKPVIEHCLAVMRQTIERAKEMYVSGTE